MTTVEIDAKTGLLGLLGNPVAHSVSPAIHGMLASIYHQNYAYLAFQVQQQELSDVIKGAGALKVRGMNVTVPHKQAIMPYLSEIDHTAQVLGAVNTLVSTKDGYKGYNTDMPGLIRAMESDGVTISGKPAVVIGAGGVANAVLGMLIEKNASEILIINRNREHAAGLAERFRQAYGATNINVCTYEEDYLRKMKEACGNVKWTAFQATSVGMYPNCDAAAIENEKFYERLAAGYDMIFNPYETKFMKLCREHGADAYNGLKMLLYQGIAAFELWTGVQVSEENAEKVLRHLKAELGI